MKPASRARRQLFQAPLAMYPFLQCLQPCFQLATQPCPCIESNYSPRQPAVLTVNCSRRQQQCTAFELPGRGETAALIRVVTPPPNGLPLKRIRRNGIARPGASRASDYLGVDESSVCSNSVMSPPAIQPVFVLSFMLL